MVRYCKSTKCLVGKTAIITGANGGIGYETALDFAKRGCRVILACRNEQKATETKDKIVEATGNDNVIVKLIDMASLDSVRKFAKNILETEDRLDLLVNNAGGMNMPDEITPDGLLVEMATNYFSHFLLTNLLLDLLKKSAPSRVINVSSRIAAASCKLNFDELNKHNGKWSVYAKSKLCVLLFTQELAKRLEGTGVTAYSLHPGAVHTEFQRFSSVLDYVGSKFFKTPEEGAQTTLYLALEDVEEHSGRHFEDCRPVKHYCAARDEEQAKKLWDVSEKMVKLSEIAQ